MISSQKMFFNGSDYCLHGELLKRNNLHWNKPSPVCSLSHSHSNICKSKSKWSVSAAVRAEQRLKNNKNVFTLVWVSLIKATNRETLGRDRHTRPQITSAPLKPSLWVIQLCGKIKSLRLSEQMNSNCLWCTGAAPELLSVRQIVKDKTQWLQLINDGLMIRYWRSV